MKKAPFIGALQGALLTLILYLPVLNAGLVWDDTVIFLDFPGYREKWGWGAAFHSFVLGANYFRPLPLLSFIAQNSLFGLSPIALHFGSLFLHACNAFLVGTLGCLALRSERFLVGFLIALVYGVHPALIESVAFVSSRFDLMTSTFLLLSLLADRLVQSRYLRAFYVGGLFLLAALCKESAAAFPLIIFLWHRGFSKSIKDSLTANYLTYASLLAAGLIYLLIRGACLGYILTPLPGEALTPGGPLSHLMLIGRTLVEYLRLMAAPFNSLNPIHFLKLPLNASDPRNWAPLLVLLIPMVVLLREFRSSWIFLAGVAALLPTLNILPLELGGGAFLAERYLNFPVALIVIAGANGLLCINEKRSSTLPKYLLGGWIIAAALTLELTLPHWESDLALWSWAAGRDDNSELVLENLALSLIDAGEFDKAAPILRRLTSEGSSSPEAWNNYGLLAARQKDFVEAESAFKQALKLRPGDAPISSNLAAAMRELGRLEDSRKLLLQSIRINPGYPMSYYNLGIVELKLGSTKAAGQAFRTAIKMLPPGSELETAKKLSAEIGAD